MNPTRRVHGRIGTRCGVRSIWAGQTLDRQHEFCRILEVLCPGCFTFPQVKELSRELPPISGPIFPGPRYREIVKGSTPADRLACSLNPCPIVDHQTPSNLLIYTATLADGSPLAQAQMVVSALVDLGVVPD